MAYFRNDNSGRNRNSGSSGRRDFNRRDGGDRQMHKAICSNCGRECEVPFMPSGNKPVYCSDCFEKMGRNQSSGPRNFGERGPRNSGYENRSPDRPQNTDQFRELNSKLDKIIFLLSEKKETKPAAAPAPIQEESSSIDDIVKAIPVEISPVKKPKAKKPKKEVTLIASSEESPTEPKA